MQENRQDKSKKSIYDIGYGTIFLKNFLVGFSRAIGSISVYLILGGLIYYLVVTKLLPQIKSLVPKYGSFLGPLPQQSTQNIPQEELQKSIEQIQNLND